MRPGLPERLRCVGVDTRLCQVIPALLQRRYQRIEWHGAGASINFLCSNYQNEPSCPHICFPIESTTVSKVRVRGRWVCHKVKRSPAVSSVAAKTALWKKLEGVAMVKREVNEVPRARLAMRCLTPLAFLILFAFAAFGQGNRGSITGTITDPQGGGTPNAAIDVKNADTGALFHGVSSTTGNYVVPVPAGKYEMTVTVPGFKKYV